MFGAGTQLAFCEHHSREVSGKVLASGAKWVVVHEPAHPWERELSDWE